MSPHQMKIYVDTSDVIRLYTFVNTFDTTRLSVRKKKTNHTEPVSVQSIKRCHLS